MIDHYKPTLRMCPQFWGSLTVKEHAKNLADRFIAATRNRIDACPSFTPLLGLSGGLDSRAVLV
jgi:hypothetical protein